jgi:nucleoid-associated protein EbfC
MTNTPDDHQPMVPDVVNDPESGAMGGFDLGGLREQAAGLQQQMLEAQERANAEEVEGVAGGGVVKVRVSGGMEFLAVTIDPDVVDPADVEMLQDLVLAALHDAASRVQELHAGTIGGLDLGGMDLGGLLGGAG